jgi:hypothetical protein
MLTADDRLKQVYQQASTICLWILRFHSRCANEGKPDVISNQFSEPTYIDMHTNFQASAARMRSLERWLLFEPAPDALLAQRR